MRRKICPPAPTGRGPFGARRIPQLSFFVFYQLCWWADTDVTREFVAIQLLA